MAEGVLDALILVQWRARLRALVDRNPDLPRLLNDRWIITMGWSAPLVLPFVFIVAWLYLLVSGLTAG